jgi:ABC-type nickel/cobalt efflux system permease component RcnA
MHKARSVLAVIAAALWAALWLPAASASAHPLGNFTINHYSRIELSAGRVTLRYVLDMAEIPTFQEMSLIDLNRDGEVDASERDAYVHQKLAQLLPGLRLQVNGMPLPLSATAQTLSIPPGQGSLPTLRLVADFEGTLSPTNGVQTLDYKDENYADHLGWKEIVLRGGDGVALSQPSVPASDRSAELTRYPDDMLTSPLDVRVAHTKFTLTAEPSSASQPPLPARPANILDRSRDELAALIATPELSLTVIIFSLLAAFGLGALHSLSPGHGKTVVGAYLVGSRGTAWHAVFLGLTVTLTHTLGVFALGLVTLFASQFILPEQLYPWLSLVSGGLVAAIGLSLFATRLRTFLDGGAEHAHAGHAHDDTHPHDHVHPHTHSHLPPATGGPVSWRNLLALGISGGLLPCPSALVVLLGAIALHRVAFGLLLIVAFSLGLAGVLTGIGLLMVYAARSFGRVRVPGRVVGLLPVGSSLVVTALGLVLLAEALAQVGVLRL